MNRVLCVVCYVRVGCNEDGQFCMNTENTDGMNTLTVMNTHQTNNMLRMLSRNIQIYQFIANI